MSSVSFQKPFPRWRLLRGMMGEKPQTSQHLRALVMCRSLSGLISHLLLWDEGYGFGGSPGLSQVQVVFLLLRELQASFKTCFQVARTISVALVWRNPSWHCRQLLEVSGYGKMVFSCREDPNCLWSESRARFKEIIWEIKNEQERKEAWSLNPVIQFRQRQGAPEDIITQHRNLPEIP